MVDQLGRSNRVVLTRSEPFLVHLGWTSSFCEETDT